MSIGISLEGRDAEKLFLAITGSVKCKPKIGDAVFKCKNRNNNLLVEHNIEVKKVGKTSKEQTINQVRPHISRISRGF